jgi:hypothetical protein
LYPKNRLCVSSEKPEYTDPFWTWVQLPPSPPFEKLLWKILPPPEDWPDELKNLTPEEVFLAIFTSVYRIPIEASFYETYSDDVFYYTGSRINTQEVLLSLVKKNIVQKFEGEREQHDTFEIYCQYKTMLLQILSNLPPYEE